MKSGIAQIATIRRSPSLKLPFSFKSSELFLELRIDVPLVQHLSHHP